MFNRFELIGVIEGCNDEPNDGVMVLVVGTESGSDSPDGLDDISLDNAQLSSPLTFSTK